MAQYEFPAGHKAQFESNALWTAFEATNGNADYGYIDAQGNGRIDDVVINILTAAGIDLDAIAVAEFAAADHATYIAPYATGFVETDVVSKPAGSCVILPRDIDYFVLVQATAGGETVTIMDTSAAEIGDEIRVVNVGNYAMDYVTSGGDSIVGPDHIKAGEGVTLKMTALDEWTVMSSPTKLNATDFAPSTYYEQGDVVRFQDELYVRKSDGTSGTSLQDDRFFWSKAYSTIDSWLPVRAASFADVDLTNDLENGDVIDGVTLATFDRVLIAGQDVASQNGIYSVQASGAAVRVPDADGSADFTAGKIVYVEQGTSNEGKHVKQVTTGSITLGVDAISFKTVLTPGAGLTKQGVITSDADVGEGIYNFNASAGAFDYTVLAATGSQERRLLIGDDVATNNVTIKVQAGERLNGVTDGTYTVTTNGEMLYMIDRATGDWDLTVLGAAQMTTLSRIQVGLGSTRNDSGATHYLFANNLFSQGSDLSLSGTGSIQGLQAGKTYKLTFSGALDGASGSGNAAFRFVDLTADAQIGEAWEVISQGANVPEGTQSGQIAFFTPTVTTEVGVDFLSGTMGELGALATFTVEELPATEAVLAGMVTPTALAKFSVNKTVTQGLLATAYPAQELVTWDAESYDVGADFDLANNKFVAPRDGYYHFSASTEHDSSGQLDAGNFIQFVKNGTTELARGGVWDTGDNAGGVGSNDIPMANVTADVFLSAGDEVEVYVSIQSGQSITGTPTTSRWSGHELPSSTVVGQTGSGVAYATGTEVDTGDTLDGNAIYETVISGSATGWALDPTVNNIYPTLTTTNVDCLLDISGVVQENDEYYAINTYYDASNYIFAALGNSGVLIKYATSGLIAPLTYCIRLRYTKP